MGGLGDGAAKAAGRRTADMTRAAARFKTWRAGRADPSGTLGAGCRSCGPVNRLCWAKIYLERAGLITRVRRGVFTISDAGRAVLAENPAAITLAYLDRFESFRKFREARTTDDGTREAAEPQPAVETPDAVLEKAHEALNDELAAQLLDEIADRSPLFFEKVVLDLMRAMGYGGWGDPAGRLTGKGADEGIDGIIHEDRLGLDTIYLQAKRWEHPVGRPQKMKTSLASSWAPSTAAGHERACSSPRARSRATRSNTRPRSTPRSCSWTAAPSPAS